ncbi:MAG: LuxR C-terminal-related transcriptional regulator [Coriobacteriales bacterium]|jgi:DNA-binding CsgD family transcriptional regulator|nr:LuxR C-terminal-related transcriptional regulator [Coriobacteriales bacterium]
MEVKVDNRKRQTLASSLGTVCPWLRYLGLGVWLAWLFLAFNGTVWLSDVEIDGSNLSTMYLFSEAACAAVLISAALFRKVFDILLRARIGVMAGALVASLGAIAVIFAGPYYSGIPFFFYVGNILMGMGSALLVLKCGQLYGDLQPQKALLYALLSQLVLVLIFYFVVGNNLLYQPISGGPSLMGIIALVLLPLLAAYLITIVPTSTQPTIGEVDEPGETAAQSNSIRTLPPAFWKFVFAILVFTFAASVAQGYYTTFQPPASTLIDSTYVMIFLAGFASGFILLVIRYLKKIALNKLYLLCMVIIAVVFAVAPLFNIEGVIFSRSIGFLYSVFDFLVWCLLAFIAFDKHISSTIVFGLGRGVFIVGSCFGWFLGIQVLHSLVGTGKETVFYIVMAFLILLSTTLVFTEKDFDLLFKPQKKQELDLEDLFPVRGAEITKREPEQKHERPWLLACRSLAKKSHLSSREREVLELLATGYGSEDIAENLSISITTVRTHTQNVYNKLDIHSRQELTARVKQERAAIEKSTGKGE